MFVPDIGEAGASNLRALKITGVVTRHSASSFVFRGYYVYLESTLYLRE